MVHREYFQMNHSEALLVDDLDKSHTEVYYFLMHAVRKENSSTSKLRVDLTLLPRHPLARH